MDFETSVDIDVPVAQVWSVLVDVERWPEWTRSMRSVELLDGGPLRTGSRVRIRQPRLAVAGWTVTRFDEGRSFAWVSAAPGIRTEALHELTELPYARTRLQLRLRQTGPIGSLIGRLAAGLTRRYLTMEAEGLKRRAETAPTDPGQ